MTMSIEEIRDAIQAANDLNFSGPHDGIVPFLAERVETIHEPRFPNDKVTDGATLAAFLPIEREVMDAAMPDRRLDVTFTVEGGDTIVMKGTLSGTLVHDGSRLEKPVHVAWTVVDGKIVRFLVYAGSDASADGYRRQGEAFNSPTVKPIYDRMIAAMQGDAAG
ncbi:MAG: nuclear transport factor 2 family protein [Acidimicrobiia bacterium]